VPARARIVIATVLLAAAAPAAAEPQSFSLRLDPTGSSAAGTDNVLDAFRLAAWTTDHELSRLEPSGQTAHPVAMAFARAAELVLVDLPFASYATVIPHEVFGHGARAHELGSDVTYTFRWPPPYGFTPSSTHVTNPIVAGLPNDSRLLELQAGISVEAYEARQLLRSALAADALYRFDAGLLFGIPLHEIVEATEPFRSNDVSDWVAVQARLFGASTRTIQHRYLYSTITATLLDPTFLYSSYVSLWRFVGEGQRSGALPGLAIGPVTTWARPHVTPVPWGLEYELMLLGRWSGRLFEVTPRLGMSPQVDAVSAGLAIAASRIHLFAHWVAAGGVDVWAQPRLKLTTGFIPPGAQPPAPAKLGARLHIDVRREQRDWFVGGLVSAKTEGLSELDPIARGVEGWVFVGVRL
jgi:hypothetical protein